MGPTAVVIGHPSPGFVGNPGEASGAPSHPVAVVVRTPTCADRRPPGPTVTSDVNPGAMLRQFVVVIRERAVERAAVRRAVALDTAQELPLNVVCRMPGVA